MSVNLSMQGIPNAALPAQSPQKALQNPAARQAAEQFEAVFINELLSHMDQGLSTEAPFSGGQSEAVYRGLFDDEVAKQIAKRGGVGIADNVYREILKMQEGKSGRTMP